jgi:hypothetical protein
MAYRLKKLPLAVAVAYVLLQANTAHALPFSLDTCVIGCGAFGASGGGSIEATVDIVNGNDLLITLTNSLNSAANGDAPYVDWLGFLYHSPLAGATIQSFTVLSGTVSQPSLINMTGFYLGIGFNFANSGPGGFQALTPDESIRILVATSGFVHPALLTGAVAQIGGIGKNGRSGAIIIGDRGVTSVPEPTVLTLVSVAGFGALFLRRRRSS